MGMMIIRHKVRECPSLSCGGPCRSSPQDEGGQMTRPREGPDHDPVDERMPSPRAPAVTRNAESRCDAN